jgi:hypothetical protein
MLLPPAHRIVDAICYRYIGFSCNTYAMVLHLVCNVIWQLICNGSAMHLQSPYTTLAVKPSASRGCYAMQGIIFCNMFATFVQLVCNIFATSLQTICTHIKESISITVSGNNRAIERRTYDCGENIEPGAVGGHRRMIIGSVVGIGCYTWGGANFSEPLWCHQLDKPPYCFYEFTTSSTMSATRSR